MKIKRKKMLLSTITAMVLLGGVAIYYQYFHYDSADIGRIVDEFNGVNVYYNGATGNVVGRNVAPDGYNLGQKYQCVEFIKRYYYERFNHKMPDSYGHAKDFFDAKIADGQLNSRRNLLQFRQGSTIKPQVEDILVLGGNRYGHVAIISRVGDDDIEIIQQNPGAKASSRETFKLFNHNGQWTIDNSRILGYLRRAN